MSAGFIVQLFEIARPVPTAQVAIKVGLLNADQVREHMLGAAQDAGLTAVNPLCHINMLRTQEQLALLPVHLVDQAMAALSRGRGVCIATVEGTRPDPPEPNQDTENAGTTSDGPASHDDQASGPTP